MNNSLGSTNDKHEVRAVVEQWAAAVRRMDVTGILSNHSENILMFDVPPPFQSKGLDAYRRTWDLFFSWSREPIVFDIVEMTVTADNDVAFVAAVMRCGKQTTESLILLERSGVRPLDRLDVLAIQV